MQPSTVLFLAANPVRTQRLQLDEECRAIQDKIRTSKFHDQIQFRSWWAARPKDLLLALNEDMPSVLHFSGHGSGYQGLCFQSDDGSATTISTDNLSQVMRAAGASVTLVVLNACYSEVQAQVLVAHIPCVIGMSNMIGDQAAILYTESFYSVLASGKSVASAHQFGLAAVALHSTGDHTWHITPTEITPGDVAPRLLTRSGIDAERIYLVPRKTRCMVIIKATMDELNAAMLARAVEEFRQLTGDLSIQIIDIDKGSVRLTLLLSPAAAKTLVELKASGRLTQLCGFDVAAVFELGPSETAARQATEPASVPPPGRTRVHEPRRPELRTPERPSGGTGAGLALAYEPDRDIVYRPPGRGVVPKPTTPPDRGVVPKPTTPRVDHSAEQASLACIQDGRRDQALKILMVTYGRHISAFALRVVRNHEVAKDIHQQVFLEAFQGIGRFQGRSSLWSWLCGIAYHRCLDELRRSRRAATVDDFDVLDRLAGEPEPSMDVDGVAKRRALEHCLGKLAAPLRSQVLMRCFLGLSYVEIGEIIGDSAVTVQVRMSRILPRLRRCLRGEGVGR
jgi:RNA polymerase sigma factor (sigma-70 family)